MARSGWKRLSVTTLLPMPGHKELEQTHSQPDDPLYEMRVAASRFVLGRITSWELVSVADRALDNRVYSDSLAELPTTKDQDMIMSDVGPLFERATEELGISLPGRVDATWIVVRYYMQRLVAQTRRLESLLAPLVDLSLEMYKEIPDHEYCGDGLDIARLCALYFKYSCPSDNYFEEIDRTVTDENERQDFIDKYVRQEAKAWLERHPE